MSVGAERAACRRTRSAGPATPYPCCSTREWAADLLVVGHSDVGHLGRAYVGDVTRGVLEFSDTPVLVVPRRA